MAKRRSNGEGNIRKRKDGRWEGRYTAGRDPMTGKQIFKNVLGKTQAEVKEKLQKALAQAGKIDFTKTGKYTVTMWMDEWFENVAKIKVRPSSHQTYRGYIDHHITPNIGNIPLEKLTTMDLQKLYRKLLNKGRVDRVESKQQPKGLSAKTVRNINQVISSAMDFAVAQKIIPENPCKAVALPKVEHKEMQTIPAEQLQAFLLEAKATGVYEMYYIELATGLRRGELLGLKWTDIDWKNGIIKVRRQVARVDGQIVEAPLKTKNSYRAVTISQQAIEVLKQQKEKTNDEYVFPSPNGGPISPDSVNNMLKRVLARAGIPKVRFHDLRHTFATIALQNGVDIKTVSGMLGHFSAGFTLDTYAHVTTAAQKEAADTMGNVLQV
ncbi:MAG: site-specific integrase [Bacteroidaceae bacterium]|nr:site-specific integrase [Bacteroidaceae bacterium]